MINENLRVVGDLTEKIVAAYATNSKIIEDADEVSEDNGHQRQNGAGSDRTQERDQIQNPILRCCKLIQLMNCQPSTSRDSRRNTRDQGLESKETRPSQGMKMAS